MAQLLYITANPKSPDQSFGLAAGQAFLDSYREANPSDQITPIDLFSTDIPLIDIDVLNGWDKLQKGSMFTELNVREQIKVTRINELCDQFISADKYVFVTPMWNLSLPPMTKAYLDTICIVGKTFKYTETGPVGLLNTKKALHIQARGGIYSEGPAKDFEFGDHYLKAILSFLGIQSIDSIILEGMAQMPDQAETIKAKAIEKAKQLAKSF